MKRVVLVRPSGPRNVGMIVRAAANFGPCEIVLVAPERPSVLAHPDFEQMSHGVRGASERCRVVASLEEALADATHSIGFSARARDRRARSDWREAREAAIPRANDPDETVALVFGNEETGFSKEDAARCAELVHIGTTAEHTSLNLAVAVSVVLADLFVEKGHRRRERNRRPLSGEARAFLGASLKEVLGGRIARTPAARRDIVAMIDRMISRAPLEDRDARAWHLVLRVLGNDLRPDELGLALSEKRGRRTEAVRRAREKGALESRTDERIP